MNASHERTLLTHLTNAPQQRTSPTHSATHHILKETEKGKFANTGTEERRI